MWLPQTQIWMYNQVQYLPRDAVEAHVLCEQTSNLEQFDVPNIHCLRDESTLAYVWNKGLRGLRLSNRWGSIPRLARNISAQVLHSHFGDMGYSNLGAAARSRLKHVVTFYGVDLNLPNVMPRWQSRYQRLFRQADRFLCEGPHMAKVLRVLGCPEEKISVLHLGVDINEIPYRPRRWAPGEPLRVLIAGRFQEKKGIPYALEALAAVRGDVDLEITVIGDASTDQRSIDEKRRILQVIDANDLRPAVRLVGFQPYSVLMKQALRHHVFMSPSVTAGDGDTEGGAPVSLIDMMASGMPIISTDHCDIPEVVRYEREGWLAAERDVGALTERVRWLIAHPESWSSMLDAARRYVESEYSAPEQAQRLAAVYRQTL